MVCVQTLQKLLMQQKLGRFSYFKKKIRYFEKTINLILKTYLGNIKYVMWLLDIVIIVDQ